MTSIEDLLKKRENIVVFHNENFTPPKGMTTVFTECHNDARRWTYGVLKDENLKCQTDGQDVIAGHAIIYNIDGCYAAIIIDTKESFKKEEVDNVSGARMLPLHWTERSSKENKKLSQERLTV